MYKVFVVNFLKKKIEDLKKKMWGFEEEVCIEVKKKSIVIIYKCISLN